MATDEDPRIYFAAERTLLAWVRTGITVIGLGFLVARFGLFLALVRNPNAEPPTVTGSALIGTAFVVFGACLIATSAWQHLQFSRLLTQQQRPSRYWMSFSLWAAFVLAALGTALAGYLLINVATPYLAHR